ncbi:FecR domain-containing protein [Microcoleus sp. herbarium14]|uniref:FecR family protein n=1 Tax=Microcoleus sp. herbarium14 TaxID=3055439 RepID=UPI002FCEDDF2
MKLNLSGISKWWTILFASIFITFALPLLAREIQLPGSRWVEVQQIRGTVTYQGRPAKVGDRLTTAGQQISTGKQSSAVLAVDSGIATITVAELSTVQVKGLSVAVGGGRVTLLSVPAGLARVSARRLTNPNSRLEINSPAGVVGVRGTEFAVGVGPEGKAATVLFEGKVDASAQGRTVKIEKGYASVTFPGIPPTPPQAFKENMNYELISLSVISQNKVRCICTVDPLNLVYLNDQPLKMDRTGKIDEVVPRPANSDYWLVVRSPVGNEVSYEIGASLIKK